VKYLQGILQNAHIFRIAELPDAQQGCYLVGGALRDGLLKRQVADFDFATPGDPTNLARHFAQTIGGKWFMLDMSRRQSRIVVKRKGKSLTYDFAPFRGPDLETDLLRRDFTVNAMALPLDGALNAEDILDPLGGQGDLTLARLRACSPAAFRDDPLRILRGIRHSIALGFHLEEKTIKWMREAAHLLTQTAPERIRNELAAILGFSPVARSLALLKDLSLGSLLFGSPEGSYEKGVKLAKEVEEAARLLEGNGKVAWVEKLCDEKLEDGFSRIALLKLAGFLRGYAPADLYDITGSRLRLSNKNASLIRSLADLPRKRGAELKTLRYTSGRGRALWAATLGQSAVDSLIFLAALESPNKQFAENIRGVLHDFLEYAQAGRIPDLLDGHWLRKNLGLAEGPAVGKMLEQLRREEIEGRVQTPEDAKKFLKSLDRKMIDKETGDTL
jgi:poly(A) polymerase